MTITAKTRVCTVMGDPVGHSMSPQLHNRAFQSLGLDYVYTASHVLRGDAENAVKGIRALGLRGASVTIPHKVAVIPHLDSLDETAAMLGSVNTIVNDEGRLRGYSTDGPGAMKALAAEGVQAEGEEIVLLGSGGAARAIAFTLAVLKPAPSLSILGVVEDELSALGEDIRKAAGTSVQTALLDENTVSQYAENASLLIHATPVGMYPETGQSLVPPAVLRKDLSVFDVVYNPQETRLLYDAAEKGAKTVSGLGMFVHQAAIQFTLWTGCEAPAALMTQTVQEALKQ